MRKRPPQAFDPGGGGGGRKGTAASVRRNRGAPATDAERKPPPIRAAAPEPQPAARGALARSPGLPPEGEHAGQGLRDCRFGAPQPDDPVRHLRHKALLGAAGHAPIATRNALRLLRKRASAEHNGRKVKCGGEFRVGGLRSRGCR